MTQPFLCGAVAMASAVVALFFLRFYRDTRDRLFGFFAAAFVLLAIHWTSLAVVIPDHESRHYLYLVRLAAFVTIILGVIDKNRRGLTAPPARHQA